MQEDKKTEVTTAEKQQKDYEAVVGQVHSQHEKIKNAQEAVTKAEEKYQAPLQQAKIELNTAITNAKVKDKENAYTTAVQQYTTASEAHQKHEKEIATTKKTIESINEQITTIEEETTKIQEQILLLSEQVLTNNDIVKLSKSEEAELISNLEEAEQKLKDLEKIESALSEKVEHLRLQVSTLSTPETDEGKEEERLRDLLYYEQELKNAKKALETDKSEREQAIIEQKEKVRQAQQALITNMNGRKEAESLLAQDSPKLDSLRTQHQENLEKKRAIEEGTLKRETEKLASLEKQMESKNKAVQEADDEQKAKEKELEQAKELVKVAEKKVENAQKTMDEDPNVEKARGELEKEKKALLPLEELLEKQRQLNTKISATGNQSGASPYTRTLKEVETASLPAINNAETELDRVTGNLPKGAAAEIKKILDQAKADIESASHDDLDDRISSARMPGGAKGLLAYQEGVKRRVEAELKKQGIQDTNEAKIVMAQVEILHRERGDLLTKRLKTYEQDTLDNAWEKLNDLRRDKPKGIISADDSTKPRAEGNKFHAEITANDINAIELTNGKSITIDPDGQMTSNDAKALGLAQAAAGYKKIKIGGDDPWKALEAAKVALANGVEEVTFSPRIQRMLEEGPEQKSIFSYWDKKKLNAGLEEVNKKIRDNKAFKSKPNSNMFNPKNSSILLTKFKYEKNDKDAHKKALTEMSVKQRAQLILEMEDKGLKFEDYWGGKTPPYEGVKELVHNNPTSEKVLKAAYKGEVETRKELLRAHKGTEQDAKKVAMMIVRANANVREELYNEIEQLKPTGDPGKDATFRAQLRGNLYALIIDTAMDKDDKTAKKDQTTFCKEEITALFKGLDKTEIEDAYKYFDDNLDRQKKLVKEVPSININDEKYPQRAAPLEGNGEDKLMGKADYDRYVKGRDTAATVKSELVAQRQISP